MFEVTVTRRFRATHALRNYRGSDEVPHEHDWTCSVTIAASHLDSSGCAIDFVSLDDALDDALAPIANRSIGNSGVFTDISPSSENIAHYIYRSLASSIDCGNRRVKRVTIWEDADHSATYFET